MKRSLFDKALELISPRRAAIRQHFKRMEGDVDYRDNFLAMMRTAGYRSAQPGMNKTPWMGTGKSADAEILQDLPALRNHSRELNRDDPIGSGLSGTFVRNVIGTGMRPQAQTKQPDKNANIEAVWKERKDSLFPAEGWSQGEAQRVIFGKALEDGDMLPKTMRTPGDPLWFEAIEGDRLATPLGVSGASGATGGGSVVKLKNGEEIRDGVQRDKFGRPTKYWILKHHPGDTLSFIPQDKTKFRAVPASQIAHLKLVSRPGQTRGVPMFHAVLQDLRDLDLLLLASLKRVQIAACLSVFITSEGAMDEVMEVTAKKEGYQLDQKLEPGMIFKLYPGESVETLLPNFPTPELAPFIITLARRIGAALGVSWQIVLKDFSESNYSSARTDLLESRQVYKVFQSWFIEHYLNWQWFQVLQDALLRGDVRLRGLTLDDFRMVRWIPNGWKWIDPVKEAMGAKIELAIGTTSLRDLCAQNGNDWEEIQDQRLLEESRERSERKRLGLPMPEDLVNTRPAANTRAPRQQSIDGNGGTKRLPVGAEHV